MKQRCANPKNYAYSRYGGRGIIVCERWRSSFESFFSDLGPRPSAAHSLDRIDNNGNYEPGNVRWATREEQGNNKRNNRLFELNGETKSLKQWSREFGVGYKNLHKRISKGIPLLLALVEPLTPGKKLSLSSLSRQNVEHALPEADTSGLN